MIVVTFDAKGKWKKKLGPKKLYGVKEASRLLGEAEAFAQEHQIKGSVEYSILNENEFLFRDVHTLGAGQSSNLLFLVRNALNTTFKSSSEDEKNRLLELMTEALKSGEGHTPSPELSKEKGSLIKKPDKKDHQALQKQEMKEHRWRMKEEKRKKVESKKAEKRLLADQRAMKRAGIQSEKRRLATLEKKKRLFEQQKAELLAREQQEAEVIKLERAAMEDKKLLMEKDNLSEKQFYEELEKLEREHATTVASAEKRMTTIQNERKQLDMDELEESEENRADEQHMPSEPLDFRNLSKSELIRKVAFWMLIFTRTYTIKGFRFIKAIYKRWIEKKKRREEARNKKLEGELELQNIKKGLLLEMKKEQQSEHTHMKAELRKKNKEVEAFHRKQERYKRELARSRPRRGSSNVFAKIVVCLIVIMIGFYFFHSDNGYHILSQWKDALGW